MVLKQSDSSAAFVLFDVLDGRFSGSTEAASVDAKRGSTTGASDRLPKSLQRSKVDGNPLC